MIKINKKAFTLIEMVVVVVVIGILTTIAVVAVQNSRRGVRDAKRVSDIKQIQTALRLYYNNVGSYPDLASITASNTIAYNGIIYMSDFPQAPTPADGDCSSSNNEYIYTPTGTNNSSYQISFCLGGQIADLSQGEKCATPDGIVTTSCSILSSVICDEILLDERDNQSYETIQLGNQCWMAENLNVGTIIDSGTNQQNNPTIEKYCSANNQTNCDIYGGLYQWDEAMNYVTTEGAQGICPDGWHIPNHEEWKILEIYLGITSEQVDVVFWRGTNEGSKLAGNASLWSGSDIEYNPDFGSSGFNALPAGDFDDSDGNFRYLNYMTCFWSSLESGDSAWFRHLYFHEAGVYSYINSKADGFSVRCLKD